MARWAKGEQAVQFLVDRNRVESFEAEDLAALAEAQIGRAVLRVRDDCHPRHWPVVTWMAPMWLPTTHTGWLRKHSWLGKPCALPAATGRTWLLKMPYRRNSKKMFRHSRSRRLIVGYLSPQGS